MVRNKRGSSTVLLAMIFVTFSLMITLSFRIARAYAVRSECESFGRVWTKAILSEYDRNLLNDYRIMGYYGNDAEVISKLQRYSDYSMAGKLGVGKADMGADLTGFELSDTRNFRAVLKDGFGSGVASALLHGEGRSARAEGYEFPARIIRNPVVLDTLPSRGAGGSVNVESIAESLKNGLSFDHMLEAGGNALMDTAFIREYFSSHTMSAGTKPSFFQHEWEYLIAGGKDDNDNYLSCRRRIFLIRNILNLAALYKDPEKVELISAAASLITPGPLAVVTQGLIMEAWAAIESELDVDTLADGGRVPLLKSGGEWQASLKRVIGSQEVSGQLGEEAKEQMRENSAELARLNGEGGVIGEIREGQTYEDYLMLMILAMGENTRLLRIMDLVQINMKYRYYEDFNLAEYYRGVRVTIHVDQETYEFEDQYR